MKLTKWFSANVKPVRTGVYQTQYYAGGGYSMWNGEKWGSERDSINGAVKNPNYRMAAQDKPWRGLVEKQT